jgi:hypothetical protein
MPVDVILVLGLSAGVIGLAFWRGGKPEMAGAAIVTLGWLADFLNILWGGPSDFSSFSISRFLIDLAEFSLILALALYANRVWPMFAAAAQLVAIAGSLAVWASGGEGMQVAYWAVTQLPLFGHLAALALGTFFHTRRRGIIGPYRDWRGTHSPAL